MKRLGGAGAADMGRTRRCLASRAIRLLRMARAAAGLALFLIMAGAWLCIPPSSAWRLRIARRGWSMLLAAFAIEVVVDGVPARGALIASNHVSWTDIPVLAALAQAGFVAKGEVGHWPVIGRLAEAYGCVLVDRANAMASAGQARALADRLDHGTGVILFPEGTTGPGDTVLPFRSSLFAAAGLARGCTVQPVAIVYAGAGGAPLDAGRRSAIAWLGEDALLPHALALAAGGPHVARVRFGEPFTATDRKEAARCCHAWIEARLLAERAAPAQPGLLNRAA